MGAGEVLSYTINVDGTGLFIEKFVITDFNAGQQPKMLEFIIPPNSTVKFKLHSQQTMVRYLVC